MISRSFPFPRPHSFLASRRMAAQMSPFTKLVVQQMRKLYPEELADKSWDNTGLLLEAPHRPYLKNSVLLTVDLTKAVVDEAIERKDSLIIAYHPIIFRPLKSLTLADTQQNSLLRLAQEGISVYSPHTACDAAPGGLNDWLADRITANYDEHGQVSQLLPHNRKVVTPAADVQGMEGAGYGRIVTFKEPQRLGDLISNLRRGIEDISGVSVAVPQSVPERSKADLKISSVGLCAGSGGSVLKDVDADMLLTGELSHHQALAAIEEGRVVVTTFHSNSERGFLRSKMLNMLQVALHSTINGLAKSDIDGMFKEKDDKFQLSYIQGNGEYSKTLEVPWRVAMSEVDKDPFEIL